MSTDPLIVWTEPPTGRGPQRDPKYTEYVAALIARPNEWACLRRHPNRRAVEAIRASLAKGKAYARMARPGALEAVTRSTGAGDYGVWARWVPAKEDRP